MLPRPSLLTVRALRRGLALACATACGGLTLPCLAQAQPPALNAQAARAAAPPQLQMGLTEQAALVYAPRRQPQPGLDLDAPPKAKLGLEFHAPDTRQKLRGLLRVQLTSDSSLGFRPRSRGLEVSYQAQF